MVFEGWDPWEEERRLWNFMRRMMRSFFIPFVRPLKELEELRYETFPVDLSETNNELILHADLPGFEKDEIKIHVTEDSIDISAERKREKKVETKTMYRQERSIGSLRRYMSLPVEIDPETVEAEFKNGVLTVTMTKKKIKKGKEVKIK